MRKLSTEQFEQARTFIKTEARDLERALFEYEFEQGSSKDVLEALGRYQNSDGGFGRGLEPDFRCEASSALASTVALQHLSSVGVGADHEMVKSVIGYFMETYRQDLMGWEKVSKEVESAPRAPWWNYNEPHADWGNPSAEVLGYFYEYRSLVPEDLLNNLTEHAIGYINELEEYEFHELLCFLRLAKRLPEGEYKRIEEKLRHIVKSCVSTNRDEWGGYCLQPIQVVDSPDSRYFEPFSESVSTNLNHLIEKQPEKGIWEPTWSWGQYEDAWAKAKDEWSGSLTLDYLKLLRAFDRIEGITHA